MLWNTTMLRAAVRVLAKVDPLPYTHGIPFLQLEDRWDGMFVVQLPVVDMVLWVQWEEHTTRVELALTRVRAGIVANSDFLWRLSAQPAGAHTIIHYTEETGTAHALTEALEDAAHVEHERWTETLRQTLNVRVGRQPLRPLPAAANTRPAL